jgi:uncharacterized peroxidase-related enzyme
MAFFELPKDEDLPPESRKMLEEYQRLSGITYQPPNWTLFGRFPKIIEARLLAFKNMVQDSPFSIDARNVAVMLVAHAKRCQTCFAASRIQLAKLGFDEGAMDAMCAHPETLPLKERDSRFVHYALKIGTDSANLTPMDFREMEQAGFSKDEILELIAIAAYWNMHMIFTQAVLAGLAQE